MAVRRTREQKIKAQQRRSEIYEWNPETVDAIVQESDELAIKPKKSVISAKKIKPNMVTSLRNPVGPNKSDQNLIKWLKADLLRTTLATGLIVLLIVLAYWISL